MDNSRAYYDGYLLSDHWKAFRAAILARNPRCERCGAPSSMYYEDGTTLHVHHLTYDSIGRESPNDVAVLCHSCHALIHGKDAWEVHGAIWCIGCDMPCGNRNGDGRHYCADCGEGPYCRECIGRHSKVHEEIA